MDIKGYYQVWSIIFFDKKTGSGISVNAQLAEKLRKPVTKKFKRRKFYARFKDLIEMGSLSFNNKNVKYLICVIDVFTKSTWIKALKDKSCKSVLNAIIKIVNESNCKLNYGLIKKENFLIKLMQEWLDNNDILMYSTHNEDKSVNR